MFESDALEVWNLTAGQAARAGACEIFNVVGRVHRPEIGATLTYSLNGGPERAVFVRRRREDGPRLSGPGHFNIDTISSSELRRSNHLRLSLRDGPAAMSCDLPFDAVHCDEGEPRFALDLERVSRVEDAGQVVDGRWTIARDAEGRPFLGILPDDIGYDRAILIGCGTWTAGYEILARLRVTKVAGSHNVGLLFKFNPHDRGDGTRLPTRWSSGLAYYRSYGPAGLKLRVGTGVHVNPRGVMQGDHVLGSRPLDYFRYWARRVSPAHPASELRLGRDYWFHAVVGRDRYALAVWQDGRPRRSAQVVVQNPPELLASGAVGVLAYQADVRVYDFQVRPCQS